METNGNQWEENEMNGKTTLREAIFGYDGPVNVVPRRAAGGLDLPMHPPENGAGF